MVKFTPADSFRTALALARAVREDRDGDAWLILDGMRPGEMKQTLYLLAGLFAVAGGTIDAAAFGRKLDLCLSVISEAEEITELDLLYQL
jgi:hypothetical protein